MQTLSCLGVIGAPPARAEIRFTPSFAVSERYDSNIFITPSGFTTPPDTKKWDLATSLIPGIEIMDKDRAVEFSLIGNANGTVYVNNPDLNYVSTQWVGTAKLDGLVGQLIPGLKLQVSDSFLYSPEAPSFVTAGAPVVNENIFARGIQAVRADMATNTASATASYSLSKSLSVQGTYAYSLFRVGNIDVPPSPDLPVLFFNTDFQRLSVGPTYKLTRGDAVGIDYTRVTSTFADASANIIASNLRFDQTVSAHGVEARYATGGLHWNLYASGGATVVQRDSSSFFSGRASFSIDYNPATRLAIEVSRQLAPAFFGSAGMLISTTAGLTVERRLAETISLMASGNYAINQGTAGNDIRFESYGAIAMLNYNVTRSTTASLSYQYFHLDISSAGFESAVNRSLAMITITTRWK
jgi:opacity protein-like surface antigen